MPTYSPGGSSLHFKHPASRHATLSPIEDDLRLDLELGSQPRESSSRFDCAFDTRHGDRLNSMFSSMSTGRLTEPNYANLGFLAMARRKTPVHDTALPLQKRINDGKFSKSDLARKLNVSPQNITNWLRRGIPPSRLRDIAVACDLHYDDYLIEAGLLEAPQKAPKQSSLATAALLQDFEALPAGLQIFVSRKASELRTLYEGFPVWLRDRLVPPKDPDRYREWERDIEALMLKFRKGDDSE